MLTKNSIVSTLLPVAIVVGASVAYGQNASDYPLTPIHFPAGKSSATISDGVERGASATYSFGAKAGQKAEIVLSSVENNGVFSIYLPGAATKTGDSGIDVQGPTIAGTDAGVTKWSGDLPKDGNYIILVAGTRGNVDYDLKISIH